MPFTKFTNLDFDQIKTSIKDYLRSNSDFSDFDFEGSNFSVLIDTLAYNTYINAFNANMVVNESFLDSATLRENVVSLARNIGYVPRSRTASTTDISFTITSQSSTASSMTIKKGLVCVGSKSDTSYVFSIPEDVTAPTDFIIAGDEDSGRTATFNNLKIYQGLFLSKKFTKDESQNQRFLLNNSNTDTSLLKVYVSNDENVLGVEYKLLNDIVRTDSNSAIYLLQEVQDEQYELLFGDGIIGKKIESGNTITANYIVTDGKDGNGVNQFSFAGTVVNSSNNSTIPISDFTFIGDADPSRNGSDIESIESIKHFAPRIYAAQNRAVTANDYESLIKKIYPATESVSVVGGEELDPPEFGNVQISIKPKNGYLISDFDKSRILSDLKQYSISGINQKIVDLKILYVEVDSSVYFDETKVSSKDSLKTQVMSSLTAYSNSLDLNKFGGRFKYSKVLGIIDNTQKAITSNITKVKIRRNLAAFVNQQAQYELCFGNRFHVKPEGYNIKSTGFTISGDTSTVYLTDIPNEDKLTGVLSIVKLLSTGELRVVVKSAGTVDYVKGEINLTTVNITSTTKENNIIEIEAVPESNDVVGLKDLYIHFDLSKSKINMVRDVISSGEEVSGTVFVRDSYTSSYSNGKLTRD